MKTKLESVCDYAFWIGLTAIMVVLTAGLAFADNPLITYEQQFCHLEPYYGFDCMTVQFWNVKSVPCGFNVGMSYACADSQTGTIIIASWAKHNIAIEDKTPILWHEIKHLRCNCSFHDWNPTQSLRAY